MYRTRQIRIRNGHRFWRYAADLCERSAALYNRANFIVRQYATAVRDLEEGKAEEALHENQKQVWHLVRETTAGTRYEPHGKWLTYGQLDYVLKRTDDPSYRALPAQANQQILKRIVRDYKSFFEALKVWQRRPECFTGRPGLPRYRKKGSLITAVLTNQICRIAGGHYLKFPGTKERINLGSIPEGTRLKEVRIRPGNRELTVETVLEFPETAGAQGKLSWLTQEDGSMEWADLDTLPDGFEIVGAGDFNGDGTDDVLLKNGGYYGSWLVQNGNAVGWFGIGDLGDATVEQIADFNGDGVDDLRVRTSAGDLGAQLVMGADTLDWK